MVRVLLAIVLTAFVVMPTYAQTPPVITQPKTTLGDLLDKGAKKLSQAEMMQLMTGATISGVQGGNFPDITYTNVYAADGTVNGNAWRSKSWFTKIKGRWSIDASGQLCLDLLNDRQEKITGCNPLYILGNSYYGVRGDTRAAEANWRAISR